MTLGLLPGNDLPVGVQNATLPASGNFAAWENCTVEQVSVNGPNGLTTAYAIQATAAGTVQALSSTGYPTTQGGTYTVAGYFLPGSGSSITGVLAGLCNTAAYTVQAPAFTPASWAWTPVNFAHTASQATANFNWFVQFTAGNAGDTLYVTELYRGPGVLATMDPPASVGLPGNILSADDSLFSGTSTSWKAENSAASVGLSPLQSLVGAQSLTWTATTAGSTNVFRDGISAAPSTPYVLSAYMYLEAGASGCCQLVFYAGTSPIQYSTGSVVVNNSGEGAWLPVVVSAVSASDTTGVAAVVGGVNAAVGDVFWADMIYLAQTDCQVLIDWQTPAFDADPAGPAFADVTPFVNVQLNPITITRGRQDALSEVQNGQLSLTLDNRLGYFTQGNSLSPWYPDVTIGARIQVNMAYLTATAGQYGAFRTRFDGAINELDYTVAPVGTDAQVAVTAKDVVGFLSQVSNMPSWSKGAVLLDGPDFHWTMDEQSGAAQARETSGNSGPALVISNRLAGGGGSFGGFQYGVETMADAPNEQPSGTVVSTVPGPYPTPVPGWYQSNVPVSASGVAGGGASALVARLPKNYPIIGSGWSLEWWAVFDPEATDNYATTNTARMGMVTFSDSAHISIQAMVQAGPTAFVGFAVYALTNAWAGTVTNVGSISPSGYPVGGIPVYYCITCSPSGVLTMYEDDTAMGSVNPTDLSSLGQVALNQICVGDLNSTQPNGNPSACGFPGSISLVSIYDRVLTAAEMRSHFSFGYDGNYGQTSGQTIFDIGTIAGVPAPWFNPAIASAGLSPVDYFALNGQTPLAAMQQAEQAEGGLLYANAAGQLCFSSRAVRMAVGGPDLVLPQGSYGADLGARVTDQYLQTSAALQGNASTVTAISVSPNAARVGPYPNGDPDLPNTMSILTVAPANPVQGQTLPYAQDMADWGVAANSVPPFKAVSATVDVLTQDDPADPEFVAPDAVAALDVNSVVTLANTDVVPSMPNAPGQLDFFVEGVTETYGISQHTILFYTSPANPSRCWIPGDPVYGVLGNSTRLGISAEPAAGGAAPVTAMQNTWDPGGPWFAPTFTATMNQGEGATPFVGVSDLRGITNQLQVMLNPPVFVAGQQWNSGGPVIAEGSWVNLPLSPIVDTWNGYQGTAPTWIVPVAGFYEICASFSFGQSPGDTTAWQNFFGRVVITDDRFRGGNGFQFCPLYLGETNNSVAQTPGALYGRCRTYCGVGARINLQGFEYDAKPLFTVLLSATFIGFSKVAD